ncbi:hypothetical protein HDF16_002274 [Granulicella aggregans]|uniref:Uncharacterized protein n=1 Tax=Granulicella aggregans TaxID=474949 RepID=A0A7W7ZD63_9BACT|nr:hypothetical protein [Granulicella aggregans]
MFWHLIYPGYYDPKSIAYLGWKFHVLPMEPVRALNTMTHGPNSDRLVLGKSRQQLQQRFGFVRTVDQVSPYLRDYCAAARPGADLLFLNSSDWMVVMQRDRAVELVLCKG